MSNNMNDQLSNESIVQVPPIEVVVHVPPSEDDVPLPQSEVNVSLPPSEVGVPVQNIWQKRAEEAAEKASKLVPQSDDNPQEGKSPQSEGKGGKGSYPRSEGKGGKGSYPRSEGKGGKGSYPRSEGKGGKELSPEEQSLRDEKTKAFNIAQDIALKRCVDRCSPKIRDDINNCISYEVNYRRTLVMDIPDDEIVVEVNENNHVYSLKRFLENRYFENKLRDEYSTILPAAWIRLFAGRDEGTYCIGIQRRKN